MGEGALRCSLSLSPEALADCPILLMILQHVTPLPVYHSSFQCDVILVLWDHQEASDGITSFKEDIDSHSTTNDFETST